MTMEQVKRFIDGCMCISAHTLWQWLALCFVVASFLYAILCLLRPDYPSYELYTDELRKGLFRDKGREMRGKQLRLVVGKDRKVKETEIV